MPEQTFGGDDDSSGGGEEIRKKVDLSKYGLAPDTNIRDVFWKIMGAYAATKKPGVDLNSLEHEKFSLMRVAISVLSRPHNEHYGLSPRFIVMYSLMMMLDGKWMDAFSEFLSIGLDDKIGITKDIVFSIKKLSATEPYEQDINNYFGQMIRARDTVSIALPYINEMKNQDIVKVMKKELIILARGDIGENQINAINSLELIKEDEDVKKSMIILLSHWDAEARLAAANVLATMKSNDIKDAATKRVDKESNEEVKKILLRLASNDRG
ncbi:HEAT repeat domain-containing protein [Candidatus Micrarchaeota archaeon]|nr:HEAT repeat domain-containing protein [Candidatus Micrarchaeota archaeon]MBU1166225.1 HEAT repeat domain-containing protein [Candidatus Micrarchaeota archaeon]MBU1886198.1 HEAT repeat domain-containing protein [Candidatus Micrarchaeota archaeon]